MDKNQVKLPAILLMGPTASGKTAAAIALQQRFPLEIISVDSAMVYRDMNIGTAKPDAAILAAAPHHLIDLIDPTQRYSAAQFCSDAVPLMSQIHARGNIPLLVGGTMLYFKALREGLSDLPCADAQLRTEIDQQAQQLGWPALHRELAVHDPFAASQIKPTDAQRIQRALEVLRLTGRSLSSHWAEQRQAVAVFDWLPLALIPTERSVLHTRIAQRFDSMLQLGLLDELTALRQQYVLHADLPAMRCVGYRQAWAHQHGEYSQTEMRERGIFATRQLAKRQLTWLRSTPDVQMTDCLAASAQQALVEQVARFLADRED